jgi:hypothetical protein
MRCGPIRRKRPVTTEERRRAYSVKAWPRTEIEAVGEPAGSIMRALAGNPRNGHPNVSGALIVDGEGGKVSTGCQS